MRAELEPLGVPVVCKGHAIHGDIFEGRLPDAAILPELDKATLVQDGELPCGPSFTTLAIAPDKTNATTFTRERACEYAADPAHATEVSLYGATPEVHEAFTTTPGSFAKTMRGLAELGRAGVRCTVFSIIWERNAAQVDDIARLVEDLGHRIVFNDVIYGRLDGDQAPIALRATRDARDGLIAQGRLKPSDPSPCIAGRVKVKIAADGGIASCELFPARFGNVWSSGFGALWRDPGFVGEADGIVQLSTAHRKAGRPVLT